jgi:hypothetical protein
MHMTSQETKRAARLVVKTRARLDEQRSRDVARSRRVYGSLSAMVLLVALLGVSAAVRSLFA